MKNHITVAEAGRRGGAKRSEAQLEAVKRNLAKARAVLAGGRKCPQCGRSMVKRKDLCSHCARKRGDYRPKPKRYLKEK